MNENKNKILDEASKLISRKGYYGAGISEILNACQIPKGSLYYYFPKGKNQMAVEVLQYAFDIMKEGIERDIFLQDHNALSVFMRMIDYLMCELEREEPYFQSLIITFIGIEATYISEELKNAAQSVYNQWVVLYEEKLEDCGYEPAKAKALAPVLCSLIHGTMIACWIKKNTDDFKNLKQFLPLIL